MTSSNATAVVGDLARRAGRNLTAADAETLADMLANSGTFTPGEPVSVTENGTTVSAETWFAAQTTWLSTPAAKETSTPPATGTRTERAIAANAARNGAEGKLAEAERMYHAHGNPWSTKTFNRSRAGFIALNAPLLAERLRNEVAL